MAWHCAQLSRLAKNTCMLRRMLWASQVAGEAVKDAPSWAGPDVIIATTMDKLDHIVAAANAQAGPSACCWPGVLKDAFCLCKGMTGLSGCTLFQY